MMSLLPFVYFVFACIVGAPVWLIGLSFLGFYMSLLCEIADYSRRDKK